MTIRVEHLTITAPAHPAYLAPTKGFVNALTDDMRPELLSVVRHIMRERGDCDMIPTFRAAWLHPTNQWGHNMTVEVTYSRHGYRAIYGVLLRGTVESVSCYMD